MRVKKGRGKEREIEKWLKEKRIRVGIHKYTSM